MGRLLADLATQHRGDRSCGLTDELTADASRPRPQRTAQKLLGPSLQLRRRPGELLSIGCGPSGPGCLLASSTFSGKIDRPRGPLQGPLSTYLTGRFEPPVMQSEGLRGTGLAELSAADVASGRPVPGRLRCPFVGMVHTPRQHPHRIAGPRRTGDQAQRDVETDVLVVGIGALGVKLRCEP